MPDTVLVAIQITFHRKFRHISEKYAVGVSDESLGTRVNLWDLNVKHATTYVFPPVSQNRRSKRESHFIP